MGQQHPVGNPFDTEEDLAVPGALKILGIEASKGTIGVMTRGIGIMFSVVRAEMVSGNCWWGRSCRERHPGEPVCGMKRKRSVAWSSRGWRQL